MQQLNEDWLARWEEIVDQVEKEHVPIECVKKIVFRLAPNRRKTINFNVLKRQNLDIDDINAVVERFIHANEDTITSMEFILDIEAVAQMLQPETDRLLKGI
jgi:Asp-tRNA(Asn)/Glu-tRNA(Gln) amidotransferase B subunit